MLVYAIWLCRFIALLKATDDQQQRYDKVAVYVASHCILSVNICWNVSMCMYVCVVCLCMSVSVFARTRICACAYMCVCMCECMHLFAFVCVHGVCARMHVRVCI